MAFDWMSDPGFLDEVRDAIRDAAARGNVERYQVAILDRVMTYMRQNRPLRESQEMQKSASLRRGKRDALESIGRLVKEAADSASFAGRSTVTEEDVTRAYAKLKCTIWPLC